MRSQGAALPRREASPDSESRVEPLPHSWQRGRGSHTPKTGCHPSLQSGRDEGRSTRAGGPGSFCDGGVAQGARPGATWGGPRAGPFPRTRGGRIGRPRCAVTRRGGGGVAIFTRTRVCASSVCARRMRAAGSACVHSR